MFSQGSSTKIERLCKAELYMRIVECVDADDPRDPVDEEDEKE